VEESNRPRIMGRKESGADLAVVCVGQQARRLLGSVAIGREAKGSELEEQRKRTANRRENERDMDGKELSKTGRVSRSGKLCRIRFCEPGKSRQGDQATSLSPRVQATDCGSSETRDFEVLRESCIAK
jgi:hypothetical protein